MKLIQKTLSASFLVVALFLAGCTADGLVGNEGEELAAPTSTSQDNACWGQLSVVYAQMGIMGDHSSQQEEPRDGLYNLAVDFYEAGDISEPSLQALGAYLNQALGLSIEACL